MKQLIIYVIVSLTAIVNLNCSPTKIAQRKLGRAINLMEEAKKLDPSIKISKIDSLEVKLIIPKIEVDTTFKAVPGKKTTLKKENLTITHEILPDGSTRLEGVVEKDTVTTKVAVEKEILVHKETRGYKQLFKEVLGIGEFWFWTIHIFGFLLILFGFLRKIGIW